MGLFHGLLDRGIGTHGPLHLGSFMLRQLAESMRRDAGFVGMDTLHYY